MLPLSGGGGGGAEVGFEVDAHPRSLCWARRAPTEGAVRETVDELEVTGDGEDVEEVEEDVHGQDGYHTESCLGPDAPQLALWPHGLHLAHLRGRQVSERGGQPCLREEPCLNGESPTVWGPEGEGRRRFIPAAPSVETRPLWFLRGVHYQSW